jgi:hypothetical protein
MTALIQRMTRKWIWFAIILLVSIRLILMATFPVIGDEAYYFYWGTHFAGGYYDLSPMIGWWESLFSKVSMTPFWLRMPNLLSLAAVAFGIQEWIRQVSDRPRATNVLLLFLFSPVPFLAVMISPDVPLMFFSFFSVLLFYQGKNSSYFFSGALWGAAFLSKYFAVFLLPGMVIWFLIQKRKSLWAPILFTLGASPFLFEHYHWNSTHCWSNIIFNAVTRQNIVDGTLPTIVTLFVAYLLILATPMLFVDVLQGKVGRDSVELSHGFERIESIKKLRFYLLLMWLVPICAFGVSVLRGKGQGLHWYLSYVPFFMMWVGLGLKSSTLAKRSREMLSMTLILGLVATVISLEPRVGLKRFFINRYTYDFNVATLRDQYVAQILPELGGVDIVFTDGYTQSAVLDYALKKYSFENNVPVPEVNVWGEGSRYGRVFDWTIDWTKLEGKKVALITRSLPDLAQWQKYFFQFKAHDLQLGDKHLNAPYVVTIGDQFKASAYHHDVVEQAVRNFYPLEKLPFKTAACRLGEF